ncbi:hypothetical protein ACFL9T_04620 [Thermodesulfobacteriota bacterium]
MDVTCGQCKTKLSVPDEKIPKGQLVRISCPKCKGKITLDTRNDAAPVESPETPKPAGPTGSEEEEYAETGQFHRKFIETSKVTEEDTEKYSYDDFSGDGSLDLFEEGAKLALILASNEEQTENIKGAAEEMGYKCISSPDTRDATGKMRFHHFDLIILSDGFDGQALDSSPVLNYLNHISMSVRRRVFLALTGDDFKTLDNMMAFALSANAVINTRDINQMSSILKKSISENEMFYKVFMDLSVEEGKA